MIEPIFQADDYQLARKLLDVAALRHEAIASNMANAETPGYHRIDVSADFERQLRDRMAAGGPTRGALDTLRPVLAEDPSARSLRPDGNNVEIERELVAMNRNSAEFEYLTEIVSHNLKQLKIAISGHL